MSKKSKLPTKVKQIQNSQIAEIDYKTQTSISFSQISTYHQCPYRWKLSYIDGLYEFQQSIHSLFGTAMHESIQKYIEIMYNESKAAADRMDILDWFKENLKENYQKAYKNNKNKHFSSPEELNEFYNDGVEIFKYFVKNTRKYFSIRGWHLVGIELPLRMRINPKYPNIVYNGYVDLVMYHEPTDTYTLYDFKTSTYSWNDKQKKDENKQFQLILYKHLFSQLYGIDPKKIDVKFVVLKRKIYDNCDFPQPRLQEITPPSGKVKTNKAIKMVNDFIENVYNPDGSYKDKLYLKHTTSCKWCPFNNQPKVCSKVNETIIQS